MNNIEQAFQNRVQAELQLSLDEVAWWNDLVARGVVNSEFAAGYIDKENRIIATKRYILGV